MKSQEMNKQKSVSFENLKKLNAIWSGNEINSIVSRISKSRSALDSFCKNLKNHEANLKKQASIPAVEKATTQTKVVEKTNIVTEEKVDAKVAIVNEKSQKKSFEQKPRENIVFNKVPQRDANRFNRNDRPISKDGKSFEKKPFVPRDNNGFKPRPNSKPEIVETIVTKPERNFGNKNKTKTFDTEKKELSKKAKIKMGYIDIDDNYMDGEERMGRVRTKVKKPKV